MASSAMLKLLCVGLLGLLILAPNAVAAIECNQVYGYLTPCLAYLNGKALDPKCCSNIKTLYSKAVTKPDRQSICGCLKTLAKSYSAAKAQEIVNKCGVKIPYPIDPKIDCTKVN